mmetsp:Transcript_2423/g.6493  ORF Transcript_2423/g.6493 Transcript_2423/m.6493 type:complete len:219 (-) Transcript_2423:370-1026(-)
MHACMRACVARCCSARHTRVAAFSQWCAAVHDTRVAALSQCCAVCLWTCLGCAVELCGQVLTGAVSMRVLARRQTRSRETHAFRPPPRQPTRAFAIFTCLPTKNWLHSSPTRAPIHTYACMYMYVNYQSPTKQRMLWMLSNILDLLGRPVGTVVGRPGTTRRHCCAATHRRCFGTTHRRCFGTTTSRQQTGRRNAPANEEPTWRDHGGRGGKGGKGGQ